VQDLVSVDSFRDLDDLLFTSRECLGELRFRVGLFLEDEAREKSDDFLGLEAETLSVVAHAA
jgi:hypothetical protein